MDTAQQAAIFKRLKELHIRQSECYHKLIGVLEKQQVFIGAGSEESILAHVRLGEQIITEIAAYKNPLILWKQCVRPIRLQ